MKKLLCPTLALTLLAACGGSGSGTSGTPGFRGFSSVPANGKYAINGQAVTANYAADASGRVVTSALSGPKGATVSVANSNGGTYAERIDTSGGGAAFDLRQGGRVTSSAAFDAIISADGRTLVVQSNPAGAGYEYQTFGAWLTGYGTGSGTLGAGSFGARTPASALPRGARASYSGQTAGLAKDPYGNPNVTSSNAYVETDFNTAYVETTRTVIGDLNTGYTRSAPELDFAGSGPVSGADFSANVSGTAVSGVANGTFYGPQAQEAGGTFRTSGNGYTYAGAFGTN